METKKILLTGASGDIGAACAEEFAKKGYELYLTGYRAKDKLCKLSEALRANYGVSVVPFFGDLSDPAFVSSIFKSISSLDLLVNAAGLSRFALLQETSDDAWNEMLSVNLSGVFYVCRAAIPLFLQKHAGKIINISSVWGTRGAAFEAAYAASKGGMDALTRSLAKELAPSNIQVNALALGAIDTKMNAHLTGEELADLIAEIPADRLGTPEEAAKMGGLLAEAPAYLTGQVILMDGGWT